MAAVKGMLSMNADAKADTHRMSSIATVIWLDGSTCCKEKRRKEQASICYK